MTCGIITPIFLPLSEILFNAFNSALRIAGCFTPNLIPCIPNIGFASTSFGAPSRFLNSSLLISEVLTQILRLCLLFSTNLLSLFLSLQPFPQNSASQQLFLFLLLFLQSRATLPWTLSRKLFPYTLFRLFHQQLLFPPLSVLLLQYLFQQLPEFPSHAKQLQHVL